MKQIRFYIVRFVIQKPGKIFHTTMNITEKRHSNVGKITSYVFEHKVKNCSLIITKFNKIISLKYVNYYQIILSGKFSVKLSIKICFK